ncbi:6-bladed beta-propeller [Pleomorphovibrio marinus]|uniref:6-bladed beta-propeller n=1 Tax=Pleomorphovibrio marinus TaxID=2164132 RepID=UPI000E0B4323|nr:6-bladed beta-propeller [Pleomorphovibrio marinus]
MLNKKNIRILIFYFSLSVVILGCGEIPTSELKTILVPNKTDGPVLMSEMAITDKKIKLETRDEAFLGHIKGVKLHRDRLFVTDSRISIFDMEGNFIQLLGKQGEGPGEYQRVNAMDIDEVSGCIFVSAYNKLLVYGPDYELIEERKLGYPIGYVKILDGDLWIVSEEIGKKIGDDIANQTSIYKLDKAFEISDTIPFRTIILDKKRIGGYPFRYWLSDIEEGLFMFMPVLTPENLLRDTLYRVSDKIIKPAFKFSFERAQSLDEREYQTLLLYNIVNSSSYYVLEYDQDWKRFMFLYDKKNKTGHNLSEGLTDGDGEPVFLRPLDLDQDVFYYIKKAAYIDSSIEEQNPEIGIVKLK